MLKAERKAIDRLKEEEGLVFLKHFPEDSVFKSNEFFELSSGVYINIVNKGNGNRPTSETDINCRFQVRALLGDTFTASNIGSNSNGTYPVTFNYGTMALKTSSDFTYFFSQGLASGSQYVGDSSEVKLIVPFKVSSSDMMTNGIPLYFERVQYRFDPK